MTRSVSKQPVQRMCAICRRRLPQRQLFRLVEREGVLVWDQRGHEQARALYLCEQEACLLAADKRPLRLKDRSLHLAPGLAEDLRKQTRAALVAELPVFTERADYVRKLSGYLGLACRAGQLVAGMDAVLSSAESCALVLVSEAISPASLNRLSRSLPGEKVLVVDLDKVELGGAVGRSETAVLGIQEPELAKALRLCVWGRQQQLEREHGER